MFNTENIKKIALKLTHVESLLVSRPRWVVSEKSSTLVGKAENTTSCVNTLQFHGEEITYFSGTVCLGFIPKTIKTFNQQKISSSVKTLFVVSMNSETVSSVNFFLLTK